MIGTSDSAVNAATHSSPPLFSAEQGDVAVRVDGLLRAVAAARGRLPASLLDDVGAVAERAGSRLRLSGEHTIVALAGATGSGKSSLFNQLTGLELAGVGLRRPTTSWALACAWGPDGAAEILEWMGIPPRHQVSRMSMLDNSEDDANLEGLVLLDLPDHDSTEVSHHLEVDRLVNHADLLVWVLDPQKYADAAVHERYLRPLASHGDITMVVLNQIDRIAPGDRPAALADVRRLLIDDGLPDAPVLGVSAQNGDGVDDLRRTLIKRVRDKQTARDRSQADLRTATDRLLQVGGRAASPRLTETDRTELDDTLADCAGVGLLVDAVESSTKRRATQQTSWPVTRWLGRLRPDPLKRIGVEQDRAALAAASVPTASPTQRARVEIAVRDLADKASYGLSPAWVRAIRSASPADGADLVDTLDRVLARTDLGVSQVALRWRLINIAQWILLIAAVVGLGWLVALAGANLVDTSVPAGPTVLGVPAPTLLLLGAVLVGVVVAAVSRLAIRTSARATAVQADESLRAAITEFAESQVVAPINAQLNVYRAYHAGISAALPRDTGGTMAGWPG